MRASRRRRRSGELGALRFFRVAALGSRMMEQHVEKIAVELAEARIVPVIRAVSAVAAQKTAERLLRSRFTVVELTATNPDWRSVLVTLRTDHPRATIGVGTVVTGENATAAVEEGADFLVRPLPRARDSGCG